MQSHARATNLGKHSFDIIVTARIGSKTARTDTGHSPTGMLWKRWLDQSLLFASTATQAGCEQVCPAGEKARQHGLARRRGALGVDHELRRAREPAG